MAAERFTLTGGGLRAEVLTLGATLQDLRLEGVAHPLVLGSPDPAAYLGPLRYFGAVVGRFANRIGGARFALDGTEYRLSANQDGRHLLHGGETGTDALIWDVLAQAGDRARLGLVLPDGHMGFPGTLRIACEIALPGAGRLALDLSATTDAPTLCNLAHHGYFNLDGGASILDHRLSVAAEHYLPVDHDLIPTGEVAPVADTRFDYRRARPVGDASGQGLDHNFCTARGWGRLRAVARLEGPESGVSLEVWTDAPGLQVYDGAHIDGLKGLDGRVYGRHAGIALETQGWPDAPNRPGFPPAILRPGQTYRHRVEYRFARGS